MERMFNCSESALLKTMQDPALYKIIKHNNHVRIPGDNPIDLSHYIKDEPSNEWEILDRDGINIHPHQEYVEIARIEPKARMDHPCDVFIYDSSPYDDPATHPYGVLAMAGSSINKKYLVRDWSFPISRERGITGEIPQYSWKKILARFHKGVTLPSNALVIIDRYLFSYQSRGCVDYKNGVRNIYGILNELLPSHFDGEYQILIIFDPTKISRHSKVEEIVKDLQAIKKVIRKGRYIPTIELLPISSDYDMEVYDETHDRKIISNYYSIRATRGFSAILPPSQHKDDLTYLDLGEGTWSQTINYSSHYAGIDKDEDDLNLDALPIMSTDETIRYIRRYYNRKKDMPPEMVEYICNGNRHCSIAQLRNRLIKE